MKPAAAAPSLFGLAWMVWLQPLRLHDWLDGAGISARDDPAGRIWRSAAAEESAGGVYLRQMGLLLPAVALTSALLTAGLLGLLCGLAPWRILLPAALIGGVGTVAVAGFLGYAVGVVFGVAIAGALGATLTGAAVLALGMIAGTAPGTRLAIVLGCVAGAVVAAALDTARGAASGDVRGLGAMAVFTLAGAAVFALVLRLVAGAVDPRLGGEVGFAAATAFAAAMMLTSLRAPLYLVEAATQYTLYRLQAGHGRRTVRFAPVLYHDLSRFPHPGLFAHVLLATETDVELAERVRQRCQQVPGQRRIAARLLPFFQLHELGACADHGDFSSGVKLQGRWLPGITGAETWMLGLREAARYLEAAAATLVSYHRLRHLAAAGEALGGLENQYQAVSSPFGEALRRCIARWRAAARALERELGETARRQIPNPFRTEPLTPDQGQLFRGRDALVRHIGGLLADPAESYSIALVGPRRCGKTSLLLMLPRLLPDALCIFFDLQDNPVDSPQALLRALAERAREQSLLDRRVEIPSLPAGPPFEAARQWLETLDQLGAEHRILLCIDEFERLEGLFPEAPQELLKLMGLFRGTIQHRRRVRLLVSGAAAFNDLGNLWTDNFINLRELRIGHLDRPTAVDLLQRPVSDFPSGVISPSIADTIFARTGGQPYLLQLYGSYLVTRLNEAGRTTAAAEDLAEVEALMLTQGRYYFRNVVETAPREAAAALVSLARGLPPSLSASSRNWLRRRDLLAEDDTLGIPLLGAFLAMEEAR